MRGMNRIRLGWVLLLTVVMLGANAVSVAQRLPWPQTIHPAVVEAMRRNPGSWIEVIVNRAPNANAVEEAAARLGAHITDRWPFINAFAAAVRTDQVRPLALLPGVRMVLLDSVITENSKSNYSLDAALPNVVNNYTYAVQADQVWANGYRGDEITVAVVDSGITSQGAKNDFIKRVIAQRGLNRESTGNHDLYGHGTHVAGIIGGDGFVSDGKYIGIAPGVNLVNARFSDGRGRSSEKDLVNSLQWVYENRDEYNIRVVNISSTVTAPVSYKESPTAAAVEQLWFAGIVVVVSAGNRGDEACAVCYAPANDPYVITVGAVDDNYTRDLNDDFLKPWSSRGLTMDNHSKPDIMAPGAHIISFMPRGELRDMYPQNIVDDMYFQMGGTSMSAPIVTGVVALMLQAHPNLTPDQVKAILMKTARPYLQQPAGTPGIVQANGAVFYSGTIEQANKGLTPSPMLQPGTNAINYSNTLWSNTLWSNTLWSNSLEY